MVWTPKLETLKTRAHLPSEATFTGVCLYFQCLKFGIQRSLSNDLAVWQRLDQFRYGLAKRFLVYTGSRGLTIQTLRQPVYAEKRTRKLRVKDLSKKLVRRLGTGPG